MKQIISSLYLFLTCISTACATEAQRQQQPISMTAEQDKELLQALYAKMYQAMISRDLQALQEVFTEDYTFVHMDGVRQNRSQYLDFVKQGTFVYYSEHTDALDIQTEDTRATLTGRSRVEANIYHGGRRTWRLQLSFRAVKTNSGWKFSYGKASMY